MSWIDITTVCKDFAKKRLSNQNPLIQTDGFSLLESMSAVELFDPKMDQCYGIKLTGEFNDMIESILKDKILTIEEAITIIKSLIILEVAFLEGASILESVGKCVFFWKSAWSCLQLPSQQDNIAMKAVAIYCQSLHFSITHLFNTILAADIFEGNIHNIT